MFKNKLLCLILVTTVLLQAQSYIYTTYTTKDGLPSDLITEIFQDKKGYIWIGTNNGLCVYNGVEFKTFTTLDGLSNNWITSITEDKNEPGTLWLGTIAGGVNKFKDGKFQIYSLGDNTNSNNVGNLVVDKKGIVWFTSYLGFYKIQNNKIEKVKNSSAPVKPAWAAVDKNGNAWFAEDNIIYFHDTFSDLWRKEYFKSIQQDKIESFYLDDENNIIAGTANRNILKIKNGKVLVKEKCRYGVPYTVCSDSNGSVIVRSNDIFIKISENNLGEQYTLPLPKNEEMPPEVTSPFYFDVEGNFWIGTWNKGLLKISDLSFNSFHFSESEKLNSSAIDKNGHIWTGTVNGVYELYKDEKEEWKKKFHSLNNKSKNTYYLFLVDGENRLWLNEDLKKTIPYTIKYNKNSSSNLLANKEFITLENDIRKTLLTIYSDNQKRLWFSFAPREVLVADLKSLKIIDTFIAGDNIPETDVKVFFQDSKNNIWVGGWLDGIRIFSSGNKNPFPEFRKKITTDEGLPDNLIRSFYEDKNGNLWVGTRHNGVGILKNGDIKEIINISMKDGLLSNTIWKIIEGPDNKIWLNTDAGIEQVDQSTLKVLPSKKKFLLGGIRAISNYQNKFWSFNSSNEIFIYKPSSSQKSIYPPVDITKILINGNPVQNNPYFELPFNQNNITIEFAALTFKEEKATRYQYRLLGSNNNWTDPSIHHNVSFASLSPGEYTFQVRAVNFDGLASISPASIIFNIVPPLWKRWWFILLAAILLFFITYILYRYRVKRLLEIERLRLRIASDLHDDVGTNLSSIILSSQIMEKKFSFNEQQKEYLHHLGVTASKTQDMLKEIVWLLNPMNDSSKDLLIRLKSIAAQILKDISYNFYSEENLLPEKLSLEWKRNIILIFKEILQNIIKHSSAGSVQINLKKQDDLFLMEISDDGRGFIITEAKKGNGLTNLNNRAKVISGNIIIESQPGKGTSVLLKINITQMRTGKKI